MCNFASRLSRVPSSLAWKSQYLFKMSPYLCGAHLMTQRLVLMLKYLNTCLQDFASAFSGADKGQNPFQMPFPHFSHLPSPLRLQPPPKKNHQIRRRLKSPPPPPERTGRRGLRTDFMRAHSDRKRAPWSRNASLISKTHSPARHIGYVAISR